MFLKMTLDFHVSYYLKSHREIINSAALRGYVSTLRIEMQSSTNGRKTHPLPARIKRLMQKDNEVGRIASVTPVLIGRAVELFLRKLCTNMLENAVSRSAKSLSPSHLKTYLNSVETMDFLKDIVKDIPDLQEEQGSSPPGPKRPRSAVEPSGAKGGKAGRAKRRRVPRTVHSGKTTPKSSAFAAFTQQGPERAPLPQRQRKTTKTRTLPTGVPETKSKGGLLDGRPRIVNLPSMTSAFRPSEAVTQLVDPSTLPISVQRALLHLPRNGPSSIESVQTQVRTPPLRSEMKSTFGSSMKCSIGAALVFPFESIASTPYRPEDARRPRITAEDDDYDLED